MGIFSWCLPRGWEWGCMFLTESWGWRKKGGTDMPFRTMYTTYANCQTLGNQFQMIIYWAHHWKHSSFCVGLILELYMKTLSFSIPQWIPRAFSVTKVPSLSSWSWLYKPKPSCTHYSHIFHQFDCCLLMLNWLEEVDIEIFPKCVCDFFYHNLLLLLYLLWSLAILLST